MKPTEQEILQDGLCATKYLMQMCAKNQIEGSTPQIRNLFLECFKAASEHNFKIFEIMQKKGFYETTPAAENMLQTKLDCHKDMQEKLEKKFN